MSAGVYLRSFSEDTIPPYYEHLFRIKANVSLGDWQKMSRAEKALIVAIMQVENSVQGHQVEAEMNQAKKNAKHKE